jgi:hypothetical protein
VQLASHAVVQHEGFAVQIWATHVSQVAVSAAPVVHLS